MSPRPIAPAPGDEIRHELAAQLAAYAAEGLEFVRVSVPTLAWDLENATGTGAYVELELRRLPPNDPRIRYAVCLAIVRGTTAGDNMSLQLSETAAGPARSTTYNTGTAGAGGAAGPFLVPVAGARGRSVWWTGSAGAKVWIMAVGWWRTLE
jgi:hypothetical protein